MEISVYMPEVAMVTSQGTQAPGEHPRGEVENQNLWIAVPPPTEMNKGDTPLSAVHLKKRASFENNVHENFTTISAWVDWADWEENQKQIEFARVIYQHALEAFIQNDSNSEAIYLFFVAMELRYNQYENVRNIFNHGLSNFPKNNQLWYNYIYLEEEWGKIENARDVFQRWMKLKPNEEAWLAFIDFEIRYNEINEARNVFEEFVEYYPDANNWIQYAKFEETHGTISRTRCIFERATGIYSNNNVDEKLFIAYGKFEEKQFDHEKAEGIYEYALDRLPNHLATDIYSAYTKHQKTYEIYKKKNIEKEKKFQINKQKQQYYNEILLNPLNYETWFDYVKFIESNENLNHDEIRDIYDQATSNIPLVSDKKIWQRYIDLWINYAQFEEKKTGDIERVRKIYKACIRLIPHKEFTFSKIWLLYAKFEMKHNNMPAARKFLGIALGTCPKNKLYRGYIELETELREFDKCKKLYEKYVQFCPSNCDVWIKYAKLEVSLGNIDEARIIFQMGIDQTSLDRPELLWNEFVNFEMSQLESDNVRKLFEKLLERTTLATAWITYANFELINPDVEEEMDNIFSARRVFRRGYFAIREKCDNESLTLLLEAWLDFEKVKGDEDSYSTVLAKMPIRFRKRRRAIDDDDDDDYDCCWKEDADVIFPKDKIGKNDYCFLAATKDYMQTMAVRNLSHRQIKIM